MYTYIRIYDTYILYILCSQLAAITGLGLAQADELLDKAGECAMSM